MINQAKGVQHQIQKMKDQIVRMEGTTGHVINVDPHLQQNKDRIEQMLNIIPDSNNAQDIIQTFFKVNKWWQANSNNWRRSTQWSQDLNKLDEDGKEMVKDTAFVAEKAEKELEAARQKEQQHIQQQKIQQQNPTKTVNKKSKKRGFDLTNESEQIVHQPPVKKRKVTNNKDDKHYKDRKINKNNKDYKVKKEEEEMKDDVEMIEQTQYEDFS